jgi:arylsulfatase A
MRDSIPIYLIILLFLTSIFSQYAFQKPNIIVIYTDDQGYGDVSALNPESKFQTPNIDRIANEGMIFTDGHSSDGVCTPSRYSLLTGRYSWRTSLKSGVLAADGNCLIENGRMTLASLLKENGYNTAMIGKWHLLMQFPGTKGDRDWSQPITDGPPEKGFDYYFGIAASMNYGMLTYIESDSVLEIPSMWTRKKIDNTIYQNGADYYRMMPPYDAVRQQTSDIEVAPSFADSNVLKDFAEQTVDYIASVADEAKAGTPFFVYLPLTSPHLPHCTAGEFVGKSGAGIYGDFMMETDYRVGQVLDILDSLSLVENTLVVFTADNGAESNYHDQIQNYQHYSNWVLKGGKRDIYEGGHRVPFLARWPSVITAGRSCHEPVCQVDLLATFADIVSADIPDNAGEDSWSLLSAFLGDEYPSPLRGPVIHHSSRGYFAIRSGDWKLNMFRGSGGSLAPTVINPGPGEAPFELYDLANDIGETQNLYDDHPDIVQELADEISRIIYAGRSTPGLNQPNDGNRCWTRLTTWMPACGNDAYWDSVSATGCMDTLYEEYDASMAYNDQALCRTLAMEKHTPVDLPPFVRITRTGISILRPGKHSIRILDIRGKVVSKFLGTGLRQYSFPSNLKSGLYFVQLKPGKDN